MHKRQSAMTTGMVVALSLILGACSSSRPPRAVLQQIDRILENAPFKAQPSKIVAVESAFERAAVEDGQWTAFRSFAAPSADIHLPSGPTPASAWLSGRSNPDQTVRWNVRGVWVSCDARLAISRGRLETPDGKVGTFVTLWQLQDNREYRWVYHVSAADDPQPEPVPVDTANEDVIVVAALETVQGHVADCVRGETVAPPAPAFAEVAGASIGQSASPDGTLRWQWVQWANGERRVVANYLADGQWRTAIDQPIPGRIAPLAD